MIASAAILALARRWEDHRRLATGRAQWIWLSYGSEKPEPIRFFAARDFSWSGRERGIVRALVFVDRHYVLTINGNRVGAGTQKPGDPLDVYDVTAQVRPGSNRVEIEAESSTGAGGILFAMTLPGDGTIVSDRTWRVGRSEREVLSGGTAPVVWGRPPMYPWAYPGMREPGSR